MIQQEDPFAVQNEDSDMTSPSVKSCAIDSEEIECAVPQINVLKNNRRIGSTKTLCLSEGLGRNDEDDDEVSVAFD